MEDCISKPGDGKEIQEFGPDSIEIAMRSGASVIESYTRAPRVVLVDDDVGTLDILPRFFSREGIESRVAATGAQALRLLRA